jgi:F0F1-type ATP synthase assembly protein I
METIVTDKQAIVILLFIFAGGIAFGLLIGYLSDKFKQ